MQIEGDGLSLCIQGTLTWYLSDVNLSRFIPVYTGNAYMTGILLNEMPVYPCVYRERIIIILTMMINCGLSLCIQGTPFQKIY